MDSFGSAATSTADWTLTRASIIDYTAVFAANEAMLEPAGAVADIVLRYPLPWTTGRLHVLVEVSALGGNACTVYISDGATTWGASLAVGTNDLAFAAYPEGADVTTLMVRCTGAGATLLDWVVVQNGPYAFPPADDLAATATNMRVAGGDPTVVVRRSEDGDRYYAGADQGGFSWSADGATWTTANGKAEDLNDNGRLGVWDIYARDEPWVFILTGDKDTGRDGGLWWSADEGEDWMLLDGGLGASKATDDCDYGETGKTQGSGRLLVPDAEDLVDGDDAYVASSGLDRGIFKVVGSAGSYDVCEPYDPLTLPTSLNPDVGYDALPSALAMTDEEYTTTADTWMLVGYRTLTKAAFDDAALYLCPVTANDPAKDPCASAANPQLACEPVPGSEGLDVRDIAPDPSQWGVFYVVDGGFRNGDATGDGITSDGECVAEESTVHYVRVQASALSPIGAEVVELWDTDADPTVWNDRPSWARNSAGVPVRYTDGCPGADGVQVNGNLVQSSSRGHMETTISTVSVDPLGQYVLAFYPLGPSARSYGCVRGFRADTGALAPNASPWHPLQYWVSDQMGITPGVDDARTAERRTHVDAAGAWFRDEPLLEVWAPNQAFDSVFHDAGVLLLAGNEAWFARAETATTYGWDSPYADLDKIEWVHAYQRGLFLQDNEGTTLTACHGCGGAGLEQSDIVLNGWGDIGGGVTFNDLAQSAGYRECAWDRLVSTGKSSDTWQSDAGDVQQWWMVTRTQGDEDDLDGYRAVLFDEQIDGFGNDGFCWDTPRGDQGDRVNFLGQDALGDWYYACADEDILSTEAWRACDTDGSGGLDPVSPFEADEANIGVMERIVALDMGVALVAARDGCVDWDAAGACTAIGGQGMWVVEYLGDALDYRYVVYEEGGSGCTEEELFSYGVNRALSSFAVDPRSPVTDAYGQKVVAYVTSRYCEPRRVTFYLGHESDPAWVQWDTVPVTGVPVSSGGCDWWTNLQTSAEVTSDGKTLLLYGGYQAGTPSPHALVCAVDVGAAIASGASAATQQPVVTSAELRIKIQALMRHPHVADTYFFGGDIPTGCGDDSVDPCSTPGLYVLQRGDDPGTGKSRWRTKRLSEDDLETPKLISLEWGTTPGYGGWDPAMTHVYAGAAAGGAWDLELSW